MGDERLAAEVNRLYWESDASVGEIADRLGISRRALYDVLAPMGLGMPCPDCGAELVYVNRSRRKAGRPACPVCGLEPEIALLRRVTAEAGAALRRKADLYEAQDTAWAEPDPEFVQERDAGRMAPIDAAEAYRRGRVLLIGAAALAGVAVGAITVLLTRRRP